MTRAWLRTLLALLVGGLLVLAIAPSATPQPASRVLEVESNDALEAYLGEKEGIVRSPTAGYQRAEAFARRKCSLLAFCNKRQRGAGHIES